MLFIFNTYIDFLTVINIPDWLNFFNMCKYITITTVFNDDFHFTMRISIHGREYKNQCFLLFFFYFFFTRIYIFINKQKKNKFKMYYSPFGYYSPVQNSRSNLCSPKSLPEQQQQQHQWCPHFQNENNFYDQFSTFTYVNHPTDSYQALYHGCQGIYLLSYIEYLTNLRFDSSL